MFNFYVLAQYLQQGEYDKILEILERPIREGQQIVLTPEDVGNLLDILVTMNEVALSLPENTGEYEHQFNLAREANFNQIPAGIDPFDFESYEIADYHQYPRYSKHYLSFKSILKVINCLMCQNDRLEFNIRRAYVSPMLLDFLLSEENQERGFLRNVIFQNFIVDITSDTSHPFFEKLMHDSVFTHRICRDINPNYFDNEREQPILTAAIQNGASAQCFDALIVNGADVNSRSIRRPILFTNPLHSHYPINRQDPIYSSRNIQHRGVMPGAIIYLNGGVKIPLIEAILNGNMDYVNRLLQAEDIILTADPLYNAGNDMHRWRNASPLMLAAYLGRQEMVEALLERGANINEVDEFHESAIFYALRGNQPAVFYLLLQQQGINITFTNFNGLSLFQLMQNFNYPELQELCNPIEKLEELIINHPDVLPSHLFRHIESQMATLAIGLKREEVIPYLTLLRLKSQGQIDYSFFHSASAPFSNEAYFQDTFVTFCDNHSQTPFITEGRNNSPYLVMGCQNGTYEIRHNPYSVSRAYHMLMVAHKLRYLADFPVDVLLDFVSYFSAQDIFDLFESIEVAMQVLLNPGFGNNLQP
jgi:hypothetical protein